MSLPKAERKLEEYLEDRFLAAKWQPALKAVMDAEGDFQSALAAVKKLKNLTKMDSGPAELQSIEEDLAKSL